MTRKGVKRMLKKDDVLKEIRDTLGFVPEFLKVIPESSIEQEWGSMKKKLEFGETMIPNKYKELIGLGVAAAIHCPYSLEYYKEGARTFGAKEGEIEEAIYLAKQTVGWSSYLHGTQTDLERFKRDIQKVNDYVKATMLKKKVA